MRASRWLSLVAAGGVLLLPGPALANGGAYISLDGTHFLPGETVTAEAYVSVPRARQGLLDRGPFHAYVIPVDVAIREGRPIPAEAVDVGTFSVERTRGTSFELEAEFTTPELPSAFYTVAMCNDPCTISGFREPLTGSISIVATAREGELLTDQSRLQSRMWNLRHEARKTERRLEEFETALAQSHEDTSTLSATVTDLRADLAVATTPPDVAPATRERPLIDGWAAALVASAFLLLAAALLVRRRRSRNAVTVTT